MLSVQETPKTLPTHYYFIYTEKRFIKINELRFEMNINLFEMNIKY